MDFNSESYQRRCRCSVLETEASVNEGRIERVEPLHAEPLQAETAPPTKVVPAEVASSVSMLQWTRDDTGPSAWYAPRPWCGSGGQVVGVQIDGRITQRSGVEVMSVGEDGRCYAREKQRCRGCAHYRSSSNSTGGCSKGNAEEEKLGCNNRRSAPWSCLVCFNKR